jgi:hypothetical protein
MAKSKEMKRAEAKERQVQYESLSLKEKLSALPLNGSSKRQVERLKSQVSNSITSDANNKEGKKKNKQGKKNRQHVAN